MGKRNCYDIVAELKASSITTETEAVKMEMLSVQGWAVNPLQVPSAYTYYPAIAGSTPMTKCTAGHF
jgi:hypothetical protein